MVSKTRMTHLVRDFRWKRVEAGLAELGPLLLMVLLLLLLSEGALARFVSRRRS